MRFADYSTVQSTAINNNQIRFSVSVQSFFPNLDGYVIDGYGNVLYGDVIDGRMGVFIDQTSGILRINFANIYNQYPSPPTFITKIKIDVYLKKAGFVNPPLVVGSAQMANLLTLI